VLERLARFVIRRRWWVVGVWALLVAFGMFTSARLADRWFESFSIPGYEAYEANQTMLKTFGSGEYPPLVVVFRSDGDVTEATGIREAVDKGAAVWPGSRVSSYFTTGNDDSYVSDDRRTMFAEIYPPGNQQFAPSTLIGETRAAIVAATPEGVSASVTGRDPLYEDVGGSEGPSLLIEIMIGGIGALLVLLFVFGTLPAVVIPLLVAACSILTTYSLVWALTYATDVSIIVQFLVALVGLGVAIDYCLLMIFRFREEIHHGKDVDSALVETMVHAGRAVIVSGSTVAIGLLSMILLPLPFIRSIGIGGMLIPAVSVVGAITLVPALLSLLGHKIDRARVIPKRIIAADPGETGFWHRWAGTVVRHPVPVLLAGLAIAVLLLIPATQINPADAQAKDLPGDGDAFVGRDALTAAGISPGVIKPFVVLAENASPAEIQRVVVGLEATEGITGAAAPEAWRKGRLAMIEAFPDTDGSSREARDTISRVKDDTLPALESELGGNTTLTLGGAAPEERDFVHAVYGNFPYVLAFVIILTFILLMRAFRSVVLAVKAVVMNLISLGIAFGIVVFIFQQGHGSEAIWDIQATDAVISWIPLMIFAFLFGLSMDYEVFIISRIREIYDETGDTNHAIETGIARTGKLVTSAALVLVFAFFALSTGPGPDIKQFGIGLAAGILVDATLIRSVLVPSMMRLLGEWNWWFPPALGKILFVKPPPARPALETD
jgi:RND superfamily putative drug exporter